MKRPFSPRSLALTLVLSSAALVLAGCGGVNAVFPDSVVASQVQGPPMAGVVYGGHAPITGSHIYLLQPGTSGIGSLATSILGTGTTTSPGGYVLQTNPAVGGDVNIPAGWRYVVSDSSGSFNLSGAYTCAAGQPVFIYSSGGNPGTVTNPGIVLLAILGNCPSSGALNFGSTSSAPINFVYVNEVSTIAAAYVFQPFTSALNNTAVNIGSGGSTQGLTGMANAANTAAQLYAIQGNGQISTTNDGEGHIANFQTQSVSVVGTKVVYAPNAGNGVVPQANIDTLANIIASCVDGPAGIASATCLTLFTTATDNGLLGGTAPTDTATAAINIARYPAGNHATPTPALVNANFVTNLFALPGSVVPFTPKLSAKPNDFTIAINYPYTPVGGSPTTSNPGVLAAESIAIDSLGQPWITGQGNGTGATPAPTLTRWSPLGDPQVSRSSTYAFGDVSIDGQDNAWVGNIDSTSGIEINNSNGSLPTTFGHGYQEAQTVIADQTGKAYFFAANSGTVDGPTYDTCYPTKGNKTTCDFQMWTYTQSGSLTSSSPACNSITGPFVFNCVSEAAIPAANKVWHGAIESTTKGGNLWITSIDSDSIARLNPRGATYFSITLGNKVAPEVPSIDRNGNAWIGNRITVGSISKITPTSTTPFYTLTTLTSASTGAGLSDTYGSAPIIRQATAPTPSC
jgi:streptogramin lyase